MLVEEERSAKMRSKGDASAHCCCIRAEQLRVELNSAEWAARELTRIYHCMVSSLGECRAENELLKGELERANATASACRELARVTGAALSRRTDQLTQCSGENELLKSELERANATASTRKQLARVSGAVLRQTTDQLTQCSDENAILKCENERLVEDACEARRQAGAAKLFASYAKRLKADLEQAGAAKLLASYAKRLKADLDAVSYSQNVTADVTAQ